ncbi:MAG: RpiB/LacA/LacB family sugar-phosphate isomerase [Acidimicrobiales bacterium]
MVSCWTGTGVSMAANKVPGVRAAVHRRRDGPGRPAMERRNVVALGLRLTSEEVAGEVIDAFLATDVDPAEQAAIDRLG